MQFVDRLRTSTAILTEGAVVTRLVHELGLATPNSASFIHLATPEGRAALTKIYRSYMMIAAEYDLPMQVSTPTWRAHPRGLAQQGFAEPGDIERINRGAVAFLQELRRDAGAEGHVYIAGVVGPRIDGYDPEGAPNAEIAEGYHFAQTRALANAGADLLYAPTFASLGELLGVARAFARTPLPYILAPVIDSDGKMPDGTTMTDAVRRIDASTARGPLHYSVGCVHPSHFAQAMTTAAWPTSDRVLGLQANASTLPPDQLEHLDRVEGSEPEVFAHLMVDLHSRGLRILGGCCGTSDAHIRALARRLSQRA